MDCRLPGKNTGGDISFSRGIFLTQESNLNSCKAGRRILYCWAPGETPSWGYPLNENDYMSKNWDVPVYNSFFWFVNQSVRELTTLSHISLLSYLRISKHCNARHFTKWHVYFFSFEFLKQTYFLCCKMRMAPLHKLSWGLNKPKKCFRAVTDIANGNLPWSTEDSAWCSVMTWMEREWGERSEKRMYVHMWPIHLTVQQRLMQHCKAMILQ